MASGKLNLEPRFEPSDWTAGSRRTADNMGARTAMDCGSLLSARDLGAFASMELKA